MSSKIRIVIEGEHLITNDGRVVVAVNEFSCHSCVFSEHGECRKMTYLNPALVACSVNVFHEVKDEQ